MRAVGALLAGLIAAVLVIVGIELITTVFYPFPSDLNPSDQAAVERHVANMPTSAFAMVLAGYGIGTFAGAFLAARLGRSAVYGFVIGAALLAAGVANMLLVPHPSWFWAAGILIFVVTTFVAVRTAMPSRQVATTAP
jgi:predicted MFS family arabinose efflux permease